MVDGDRMGVWYIQRAAATGFGGGGFLVGADRKRCPWFCGVGEGRGHTQLWKAKPTVFVSKSRDID